MEKALINSNICSCMLSKVYKLVNQNNPQNHPEHKKTATRQDGSLINNLVPQQSGDISSWPEDKE